MSSLHRSLVASGGALFLVKVDHTALDRKLLDFSTIPGLTQSSHNNNNHHKNNISSNIYHNRRHSGIYVMYIYQPLSLCKFQSVAEIYSDHVYLSCLHKIKIYIRRKVVKGGQLKTLIIFFSIICRMLVFSSCIVVMFKPSKFFFLFFSFR